MRILVAEKDRNGRRLLDQILKMEGHEVFTADDGEHAMNIMMQFRPDMVLMNIFDSLQVAGLPARQTTSPDFGGMAPVVFMTPGGAGNFLSGFMGEENATNNIFDQLPAHSKIGAIEYIQHLCGAMSRCHKLFVQEKNLTQRPHRMNQAADSLPPCNALQHA
ncbi:MAG: hypothetical protein ABFE02_06730 [Sulfuricella sp.]